MLQHALDGAYSAGAETRLVHLYDLAYTGCQSCFACKIKGKTHTGVCAVRDELRPVLEDVLASDALIVGSPIYFFDVTGQMRSFLERLLFPNISYNDPPIHALDRTIRSAFVFTMNAPEEAGKRFGYEDIFRGNANLLRILSGGLSAMGDPRAPDGPEILTAWDTYQFPDYSRVEASRFDEGQKAAVRAKRFPEDCRKAYELGARLAQPA